jgi:pimeloyl-ACP methyl ester carboxylesterase
MPYLWLYNFFALIIMPHRSQKEARQLFINEASHLKQAEFKRWFALTRDVNCLMKKLAQKEPRCPTLYVMGDKDRFFLKSVKDNLKDDSLCEVHVIPNCGHVCNFDRPEEFNQIVIDFMKNHH